MQIKPSIFQRVAVCKGKITTNNPTNTPAIELSMDDLESSDIEVSQTVKIRLFKIDTDNFIRGEHTTTVSNMVMPHPDEGGRPYIMIPSDKMSELDLEVGDFIGYAAIAGDNIPGIETGPIRDKAAEVAGDGPIGERVAAGQTTDIKDRGRRTDVQELSGTMFVTGQVTIKKSVREALNIMEGDQVPVTVNGKKTYFKKIGNGNRITITSEERKELGLPVERSKLEELAEEDNKPTVTLKIDLSNL